ncbi:MAG: type II toxin-antitoxin system death-on-curing family toxin [Terriglobales bacterium]
MGSKESALNVAGAAEQSAVARRQDGYSCLFCGRKTNNFQGEAAVFRPQTGYYNSIEEEAAALMESLGNNHGFLDGNKRIAFTAADVFLRRNGSYIEIEGADGYAFINGSMERHKFRFAEILEWIRQRIKSL